MGSAGAAGGLICRVPPAPESRALAKLALITLECVAEDPRANAFLHDANVNVPVVLYKVVRGRAGGRPWPRRFAARRADGNRGRGRPCATAPPP